ncbi:hypothetical protein M2337_003226 [Sphingobium sp. B2D3A]|uniref:DUF465 domain-containing protein n=1 Tax=Sphingobium TaxID=165695 RepID=UPI0015EBF96D|nr:MULTISPECIES: DUF465 domain-containing protein [Sphingobium]MCW2338993.1 hypothetical protein [Sphingobium sp. B2D3A]MCW2349623.1 hypothetical protein [Sphingobium sp. B12D2B]MCW2364265.1 hypothetical protein [Sphingobium sp. B10D3B]MCW2367224.1 hypothetical protein [Sphingobium sp. B7D2B]MCW2368727.1 hypothetical protein [Sphingobium sp. B11D3D]
MSKHIFSLLDRHQKLDEALRFEQRQRAPDFGKLQRLKRLKLAVKDRLALMARRRHLVPSD